MSVYYYYHDIKYTVYRKELREYIKGKVSVNPFPKAFYVGASTSSYQIEGGNYNCDWYDWELRHNLEKCGKASNSWKCYEDDIDRIIELGCNSYRFSVEWSRVMPQKGVVDSKALAQYGKMIKKLQDNNITPFCTLLHFTLPSWLEDGLESEDFTKYFLLYVSHLLKIFKGRVQYFITYNEPMLWLMHSYIRGTRPPGKKMDWVSFTKALKTVVFSHLAVYNHLHKNVKNVRVGISENIVVYRPKTGFNVVDNVLCKNVDMLMNQLLLKTFTTAELNIKFYFPTYIQLNEKLDNVCLDFVGLNHYNECLVGFAPITEDKIVIDMKHGEWPTTDMEWSWVYDSLYVACKDVYEKYKLPIYITENGLCQDGVNDTLRQKFLKQNRIILDLLITQHIPIRGYMYWSLVDNWEWEDGPSKRFGLYYVDYDNIDDSKKRLKAKDSVEVYKQYYTGNMCMIKL